MYSELQNNWQTVRVLLAYHRAMQSPAGNPYEVLVESWLLP